MVKQNIHTMKQPELGKRIIELRKQKGLTQEELVEQCNINVRTIQRIEAGEVNPRSYTIKTILEVLGVDYFENENKEESVFTLAEKKKLNVAWIFGIVYFVISFIETAADIYQFTGDESFLNTSVYSIVKVISAISFVFFFLGFYTVAKAYGNQLLKISVLLLMAVFVLSNGIDILTINLSSTTITFQLIAESIVFGILQIIFGISLLQLKKQAGSLIQINGILEIIVGVCLGTVLLVSLGLFLMIPTIIVEIILLYRFAKNSTLK